MNVAKYLFAASWLLAFAAHADGGVVITDSSKPAYVSSKAVYHYIMSRLKEQDNNLPGSLEEMRLAVAHDSASPYLHLALSNSLLRTYSVQSAISQAEEAVRLAPEKAEGHIQLGNIFMHTGELDRAETSFKEAIKAEPKNMDGYTELSRLFILTKKIAEAEAVFQMMMANFPGDPAGYFNAGAVFYERRVLDKAETYLRKALEKDPAHEMAGIYLSKTLEMQRRYPEAKKVLESLLHFVSDDPEILLALGRLSIISGDMQGARRYFDHLKRSSGSEAETAVTIAMAWFQEGAVEEAVREINEVAATYPDREPVKYYRGIILEEIKDYRAAADIFATFKRTSRFYYDALVHLELCNVKLGKFETAIRDLVPYVTSTGKPDPLAVHVLTEAWIQLGKIPEGVAFFNRLQKSHPSWVETAEALSRLLERQGDSAGAAAVYDDLLKRDDLDREDREKALLLKAMSLEKIGDDAGSLEYAYQALKIGPDSPEALNFIGFTLAEREERLAEAESMVTRALLFKPGSGYILDSLGWILFKQGQYAKALETLQRADRLAPDEPEILSHLGATLIKLGRRDEAVSVLQRAMACDPDQRVMKRLVQLLEEAGVRIKDVAGRKPTK